VASFGVNAHFELEEREAADAAPQRQPKHTAATVNSQGMTETRLMTKAGQSRASEQQKRSGEISTTGHA